MFKEVFVLKIEQQKLIKGEVEKFLLIQKNWKKRQIKKASKKPQVKIKQPKAVKSLFDIKPYRC
jgi:hypothetical protein